MLTLYKPNKNNKGSLFNISFSAKVQKENEKGDKSFYIKLVHQVSWDEEKQTGSFSGGESVITKLSLVEAAGILDSIEKNVSLSDSMGVPYVYHDGEKTASTIMFGPAFKKVQKGDKWVDTDVQRGFSLRITKTDKKDKENKQSWGVGLSFAEAKLLYIFISEGLGHCVNALKSEEISRLQKYSEDKAAKESSSHSSAAPKRTGNQTSAPRKTQKKVEEPEPEPTQSLEEPPIEKASPDSDESWD